MKTQCVSWLVGVAALCVCGPGVSGQCRGLSECGSLGPRDTILDCDRQCSLRRAVMLTSSPPHDDEEQKKNTKAAGGYQMAHFRWGSPPNAAKRYGGFMRPGPRDSHGSLLTLLRNIMAKGGRRPGLL